MLGIKVEKNHVAATVSTLTKYETQTLSFMDQIHDLQPNQLHAMSAWHLCKATGEDHRNLVLLNGATDKRIPSTISLAAFAPQPKEPGIK